MESYSPNVSVSGIKKIGKNLGGYKFHEIFKGKVGVVDVSSANFKGKVGLVDVSDAIFKGKVGFVDVSDEIFKGKVGVVDVSDEIFKGKYCAGNRKVFVPEGKLSVFSTNFLKFLKKNPRRESQFFDGFIEVQSKEIGSRVLFPLFARTIQFQLAQQLF